MFAVLLIWNKKANNLPFCLARKCRQLKNRAFQCHSYTIYMYGVSSVYLNVVRMSLVCCLYVTRMSLVCTRMLFICHLYLDYIILNRSNNWYISIEIAVLQLAYCIFYKTLHWNFKYFRVLRENLSYWRTEKQSMTNHVSLCQGMGFSIDFLITINKP